MQSAGSSGGTVGLYFDELSVGQRFVSDSLTVGKAEIQTFASEYDPQPFHLDGEAAKKSVFQGLVASGWHTASLTMRLLVTGGLPIAGGIIGVNAEVSWPKPTRPGAILTVESEIVELRPSRSRPDRGIVTFRSETRDQGGEVVQVLVATLIVPRRTKLDAET